MQAARPQDTFRRDFPTARPPQPIQEEPILEVFLQLQRQKYTIPKSALFSQVHLESTMEMCSLLMEALLPATHRELFQQILVVYANS